MRGQNRWRSTLVAAVAAVALCSLALPTAPGVAQARAHPATGGTIIVDYVNDFSTLDTGKCYDSQCYPFMRAMYDRLVDYDTAHAPGTTIIPDAAAAMPTISNGGLTYTFTLRHDVHFWNGRLVTSADWVYSFERIINPTTQAGAASFWMNIVGAKEYAAGKAAHVSGIQALGRFGLRDHPAHARRLVPERAGHAVWLGRGQEPDRAATASHTRRCIPWARDRTCSRSTRWGSGSSSCATRTTSGPASATWTRSRPI